MTSAYVAAYETAKGTRYRVLLKTPSQPKGRTVATGLTSRREAETLARAARKQAEEVRAGVAVATPLVRDVVADYLATLEGEWAPTAARFARVHLLPVVGHLEVAELRRADVVDLAESIRARSSGQTTRHVVGVLRAAINRALDRGEFAGANVALRVDVSANDRRTKQVLRPEELEPVLAHVREDLRDYVGLTAAMAARPGETLDALVADVDKSAHTVLFRNTKTKRDRCAVVPAFAWPWLLRALDDAGGSPWLFPLARESTLVRDRKLTRHLREAMREAIADGVVSLAAAWRYVCHRKCTPDLVSLERLTNRTCPTCGRRRLELVEPRDVKFRETRHTGGTLLLEAGLSMDDVAAQMGNSPATLRAHYDASRPTRRRKQMDAIVLPVLPVLTSASTKERA